MCPMEICIDIIAISQGPEGVSSSGDRKVFRGSGNRPRAGIQMAGRGGTEEYVDNNIPLSGRGTLNILRKNTSLGLRSLSHLRRHMR